MGARSHQFLEEVEETETEYFNPPVRASNPQIFDTMFEHAAGEGIFCVSEARFE